VEAGKGIPDLVLINESTMRFFTGKDGRVSFHVIGKAQTQTIADDAPVVDKEAIIRLRAQPEEAGLGSMANIFFGGLGIITGGAAGFLSSLIDVLKTFTYDMGEKALPVTDWGSQGWKVVDPGLAGGTISGVICNLAKPFTIQGLTYAINTQYDYVFTPTSPEAGTIVMTGTYINNLRVDWTGTGTYSVIKNGTDKVTLSTIMTVCGSSEGLSACSQPTGYDFNLVPLTSNECSQP